LGSLVRSRRITSDEETAILVSALSDRLLREVELDHEDPNDIDAHTLDEVVERFEAAQKAREEARVQKLTEGYEEKLQSLGADAAAAVARSADTARKASEELRRRDLAVEGRARRWAGYIAGSLITVLSIAVIAGGILLIVDHTFHGGVIGIIAGLLVVTFVLCEVFGILGHMTRWRSSLELVFIRRFRFLLGAEAPSPIDRVNGEIAPPEPPA